MEKARQHSVVGRYKGLGLCPWTTGILLAKRSIGGLDHLTGIATSGQAGVNLDPVVMPSGLVSYLHEVIEEDGAVFRFRFVAPDFTNVLGLEAVTADLEYLCAQAAVPTLPERAGEEARVIVSLADAPSDFGIANPSVTQVFEAFRVENGTCIWEVF